jgi:hypothetical protein
MRAVEAGDLRAGVRRRPAFGQRDAQGAGGDHRAGRDRRRSGVRLVRCGLAEGEGQDGPEQSGGQRQAEEHEGGRATALHCPGDLAGGAHPDWSKPLGEDSSKPPPDEGLGWAFSVVCGLGLATGRGAGVGVGVGVGLGVAWTGVTGEGVVAGDGDVVTAVCGAGATTAVFARAL